MSDNYISAYTGSEIDSAIGTVRGITKGNLTESTSSILTITNGTNSVWGSGVSIQVKKADSSNSGYLSNTDWSTFNSKQSALTIGNLTESTSSVLTISGTGVTIGNATIQVKQAGSSQGGYLSNTDWSTFNNKQAAITGAATTVISSDLTASKIVVSDASGKIAASSISTTTLGYLDATSSIQTQIGNKLDSSAYTANDVLSKIKTVDGASSGLDADLLDGNEATAFSLTGHNHNGVYEPVFNKTNITETTSSVLTISNGNNIILGSTPLTIQVKQAGSGQSGYLSSTDWSTFNGKQASITGAATTILSSDLTASKILISNASGKVEASSVSTTTLGYLDATSSIQTQIGNKLESSAYTANDVLAKIKTVDGASSGLDADLLDGNEATAFATSGHNHSGIYEPILSRTNLTEDTSSVLTITNGTNTILGSTPLTIQVKQASSGQSGYLSSTDWSTFNSKESTVTKGNLSESTSSILTISGGTGAVIGSGTTIQVGQSTTSTNGYLSSTDWNTFNNKQPAITGGATSIVAADLTASRVLISNGSGKVAVSTISDTTLGYLDASSSIQTQLNTLSSTPIDVTRLAGIISISNLPSGALERLVPVANQTARYALTTATVQLGDTVKQEDTGVMYYVIDEANLSNASGYSVYTAGTATAVPWSGVTTTPTTLSGYGILDGLNLSGGTLTGDLSITHNADAISAFIMTNTSTGSNAKSKIELVNNSNSWLLEKYSSANSSLNKITTSGGDFEVNVTTANSFYVKTNNATAFLIDSANKGYLYNNLTIEKAATGAGLDLVVNNTASSGDSFARLEFKSNVTKLDILSMCSTYAGTYYSLNQANLNYILSDTNASNFLIAQDGNKSINFGTNGNLRLKIDGSGNINLPGLTASKILSLDASNNIVSTYTTDQNLSTTSNVSFGNITATKTATVGIGIINTSTTGNSNISLKTGDGTTSPRNSFVIFETLEATPIEWRVGLNGDKNLTIYDYTNSKDCLHIVPSTGVINLPQLTASTMLQLDSSKNIISSNTLSKNGNAANVFEVSNTTAGTTSSSRFKMTSDGGNNVIAAYSTTTSGTYNGINLASLNTIESSSGQSGLMISQDGAKSIYLATNGVVRQTIDSAGATTFSGTTSVTKDQNSATRFLVQNPNAGAAAYSEIYTASDVANFHLYTVSSGNVATYCGITETSLNELVSTGNGLLIHQAGAKSIYLATNGVVRQTINSAGNIGIGTTDIEAWHTSFKAIEFADTAISSQTDGTLMFHSNHYYDGVNKYKATGTAASYYISGGAHVFRIAPSGTADAAITWTTALTINNSGNIGIGTTDIEAWDNNTFKAIEWYGTAIAGGVNGNGLYIYSNAYYDGANKYKRSSQPSAYYGIASGTHTFNVAPSGTADAAITWTTALAIDNSGNALFMGASKETSQVGGLSIKQGTDPASNSADQVTLYATAGSDSTLGLCTEATVTSETVTSDRTLAIKINGTAYKLCLKA